MGFSTLLKVLCRYIKCSSDCGGKRKSPSNSEEDIEKYLIADNEVVKYKKNKKEFQYKEDKELLDKILELSP
jgi:hypothetical protein